MCFLIEKLRYMLTAVFGMGMIVGIHVLLIMPTIGQENENEI